MRKAAVLMVVMMLTVLASAAIAGPGPGGDGRELIETKAGKLFLFQKCDDSGCPSDDDSWAGGPWPILPTGRWGQMKYNLLGDKFRFSFEGKKLLRNTEYTLIYYPDPWPGNNLICLGTRKSNGAGNLQINGSKEILKGLPIPDDANYLPQNDSGAVGAKIWLVLTADVQCDCTPPHMENWNPSAYLFEGNLIVYQYSDPLPTDDDDQ